MSVGALKSSLPHLADPQVPSVGQNLPSGDKLEIGVDDRAKVHDLAEEFESVFLDLVFKSMRKTIPKSELTDGGSGEEIFRSMLDSEYSKQMAKQRMSGIAATIEKDLLKLMEVQSASIRHEEGLKSYEAHGLQPQKNKRE